MKAVGIHLRVTETLEDLALKARDLSLDTFQCFMIHQYSGEYVDVQNQRLGFLKYRHLFKNLYVHASYWINLAGKNTAHTVSLLKREIDMAQSLEFNALVIHPGAATGWDTKKQGIEQFVKIFDSVAKEYPNISFILENTAHGGMTIGSDLYELAMIRERTLYPERIFFCIDTAHAYAYGYNFSCDQTLSVFFKNIDEILGFSSLSLIHLNDALEKLGEKKDRHGFPGEGFIGADILKKIVTYNRFQDAVCILELPDASREKQIDIVYRVKNWIKESK